MRVLITEDQPILINVLSNVVLEIFPNSIIKSATDINTAIQFIKSFEFDIILADLDFNGEKRFSVVELAKKNNIKCIIFTGHYNKAFIDNALDIGVVAFVSKMGNIDDLRYALLNYQTIEDFVCSFCIQQTITSPIYNEILIPELNGNDERILNYLLSQKPRKIIAKELKITMNTLNTYINRMTTKNNCNLLVLIHRYIIWKRSLK
jgi:DNA-binding NarL/FixJ family response regulator